MQPDNQNNYWAKDTDETDADKISDVYTPEPNDDEPNANINDEIGPKTVEADDETVRWSASEYIQAEKNGLWFVALGIVTVAFIATDILFLKSYTFSLLVVVMAISIIVFSRRPPREVQYTLSGAQGLYVGDRLYHFSEFKAFGVINDNGNNSIMLIPTKRFSPGVSVYFPQEVGEEIVDILGARLPMQELKLDIIDKIVRRLRL